MSLFKEEFYTEDYDQEMLDFIEKKYPVTKDGYWGYEGNLVYGMGNDYFWTTDSTFVTNKLTKEQFKEKIGMTNTTSNTVDINMLKTGMIAELYFPAYNETSLVMVLLGTENGDIVAGQSWGNLEGKLKYINKVYQPTAHLNYLSEHGMSLNKETGLNTKGCKLIWERKSPQQLEIDKLQAEVDERVKRINELKESM